MSLQDDDEKDDGKSGFEKALERLTGKAQQAFDKLAQGASNDNGGEQPADKNGGEPASAAFFLAVRRNRLDEVQKFIAQKINLDGWNIAGDTALHICARQGLPEMAQLLLDAGANPRTGKKGEPQQLPVDDAVNFGKTAMVELLTRNGGYIPGNTVDGRTLLHRAVEKGKPGMVAAMIRAGADANEMTPNGSTPLLIAVSYRQSEVAETLLSFPEAVHGINAFFTKTDPKKRTAFQIAIERGLASVVAKMLEFGADVNAQDADGATPMQHAVAQGNLALVKTLFAEGADLNRDAGGKGTALYLACETPGIADGGARAAIVAFMLRHGADPEIACGPLRQTPLAAAVLANNGEKAVAEILKHPVSAETRDGQGATPLFHALQKPAVLKLLLDAGANPDARHMEDARTPLMQAAQDGNAEAVKALLKAGANARLIDAHGRSALSWAKKKGQPETAALIEDALKGGAKPGFREFSL